MNMQSPFAYDPNAKKKRLTLIAGITVGVAVVFFGYRAIFSGDAAPQHQMPPAPVTVEEVHIKDIPLTYEYSGRTAGSREVEIRARVSGILQKRTYVEGSEVEKGQLLFRIDPAPFEAALAQAKALMVQTERDWGRVSDLYREKAVSSREYDEARSAYEQARAALKTAQINLDYTTVTAPITGVTSKEGLSEGSLVTADSSLLTRVTQLDPLYVEFAYPDSDAISQRMDIASGALTLPEDGKLRAEIHFGDGTVYPEEGVIDFTDSIIDAQTGSVRARAVVPNNGNNILPGLFVRVVVKGFTRPASIAIADRAVMQGPQGQFVYVVQDGNAAIKPIKLGTVITSEGKRLRLVTEGLEEGDAVITEGMIKVRPGAPVSIGSAAQPAQGGDAHNAPATAEKE